MRSQRENPTRPDQCRLQLAGQTVEHVLIGKEKRLDRSLPDAGIFLNEPAVLKLCAECFRGDFVIA